MFLVNSGSEANDLALRLAWAYSGARNVVSLLEAGGAIVLRTDVDGDVIVPLG